MASKQTSLADVDERVNVLFYGEAGRGKTTALAGAAKLGKVLYIDSESGLKGKPLERLGIPTKNIVPFTDISFGPLEALLMDLQERLTKDPTALSAVIWDSITETQKILLEKTARDEVGKAARAHREMDPFMIDRSWWGKNTEMMRRLIRKFRDLPVHSGWAALERRDQDADGAVKYGPAVTPALSTDLTGYADIVIYTNVHTIDDTDFYIGITRPFGKYIAKDRFGMLPRAMVDPSFDRIIAYIHEEITEDDDQLQAEYLAARSKLERSE